MPNGMKAEEDTTFPTCQTAVSVGCQSFRILRVIVLRFQSTFLYVDQAFFAMNAPFLWLEAPGLRSQEKQTSKAVAVRFPVVFLMQNTSMCFFGRGSLLSSQSNQAAVIRNPLRGVCIEVDADPFQDLTYRFVVNAPGGCPGFVRCVSAGFPLGFPPILLAPKLARAQPKYLPRYLNPFKNITVAPLQDHQKGLQPLPKLGYFFLRACP